MPTLNPHCPHLTESEIFTNLPDQPVTKPSMSAGDKLRMAMIAGVPVALLFIGLGARIYYLHVSVVARRLERGQVSSKAGMAACR